MVYPAIQVVSLTDTYLSKKHGKRSSFQSHRRGLKLKEPNNATTLQHRVTLPRNGHMKHNQSITKNMKSSPYIGYLRHAPSLRNSVNGTYKQHVSLDKSSPYVGFIRHAPPTHSKEGHSHDLEAKRDAFFAFMRMAFQESKIETHYEFGEEKEERNIHYENCISSNDAVMLLRYPELSHFISGRLPGGNPILSYYSLRKWFVESEFYTPNSNYPQQHARNYHDHTTFDTIQKLASWFLFPIAYDIERSDDDAYMENLRRGFAFLSSLVKRLMPGRDTLLICTGVQMDGNTLVPLTSSQFNSFSSMNELIGESSTHNVSESDNDLDTNQSKDVDSTLLPSNHPLHVSVSSLAKAYHTEQARTGFLSTYSSEDIAGMTSEEIQRNLDVETILRLPTITYRSKTKNEKMEPPPQEPPQLEEQENNEVQQIEPATGNDTLEWSWIAVPNDPSGITKEEEVTAKQEAGVQEGKSDEDSQEDRCVICLEYFNDGDRLRVLPCGHHFHTCCIDKWLSGSFSHQECFTSLCPTCKKTPNVNVLSNCPSFEVGEDDSMGTMGERMEGIVPSWAFSKLGGSIVKES